MKLQRLFSFLLLSALLGPLGGCASKDAGPEPQASSEPAASLPAGMVETSRLEGHSSDKEKAGSDVSGTAGPASAEKGAAADINALPAAEAGVEAPKKSDTESDKKSDIKSEDVAKGQDAARPSAIAGGRESDSPQSDSANADVQTLDSTSITARGENPWSLEAQKVEYNESSQRVRVKAIVWKLLDKDNKPRLTVRGRAADVNIETQNVAFDGPVDADGADGETMKVNHLVWDSAKQKLLGSHGVRLVRNGTVMTGDNLVASPDFKQVEVSGNVRVTFAPPAGAAK